MSEAVVSPIREPDAELMRQHLLHLFGGDLDGCHDGLIEIAWTRPTPDEKGRHSLDGASLFGVDQVDAAVAEAVKRNRVQGQNVYVGAALRLPDTPPFGRTDDADFYAATCVWCDLDDEEAARSARLRYKDAPPTLIVVTGRTPGLRAQAWWRLETPERDPDKTRARNGALVHALGGDPTVVNPGRVMRLAGTIAWPTKPGRVMEVTELKEPSGARPHLYVDTIFDAAYAPQAGRVAGKIERKVETTQAAPNGLGIAEERIADGRETYMRDTILAMFVEWCGTNGCEPTPQELYEAAWPQYSAHVDFSRPGRGPEEFEEKVEYLLRRFHEGRLPGLKTIEAAVASYQAKPKRAAAPAAEPAPFAVPTDADTPFRASTLVGVPPERQWIVPQWLPRKTVTALYGDGGVGKTLLAQQLGNAVATGTPWLGLQAAKGRVLSVFAEDERDEIWRRQHAIESHYGVTFRRQIEDLYLWPRVGFDNLLVQFDMAGVSKATAFYAKLREQVAAIRPILLVLDTAADLFGGNENNRAQVNQFVKAYLGSFVVEFDLTVLLLAHPSMSGLASGTGTGGSTGWNNSVRSRWYLQKPENGLPEQRVLTRKKANYAASGDDQKIELVWQDGVLTTEPAPDTVDRIQLGALKRRILEVVEAEWCAGRPIGARNSNRPWIRVLPRMLAEEPAVIGRAFDELEIDGLISTGHGDTHRRGYKVLGGGE